MTDGATPASNRPPSERAGLTAPVTTSAVIFDLDGVLVDSGAHHRAAWTALLGELGVAVPSEFWRLTIGRTADEALPHLLGRPLSPSEVRQLSRRKHEHYVTFSRAGLPAVAGAPAFVTSLVRLGVPRAVATSARGTDATRLLGNLGLLAHFEVIVAAEDVRRGKPAPDVFLTAAEHLGIRPEACLVFEDSVLGVQAGREAGMRVIGVTTGYTAAELTAAGAERCIADFEACRWPM